MKTSCGKMGVLAAAAVLVIAAKGQSQQAQAVAAATARFSVVVEGRAAGSAPDVILLPGLASSREVFAAETTQLTPSYRVHRIQIAGFAGEPAGANASGPLLAPVVEQLHQYIAGNDLKHPAIIGHSLGGLVALMLAEAHPEDVGKLMVVDALPFVGVIMSPGATVETLKPQAQAMREGMLGMSTEQFTGMAAMMASRLVTSPDGQKMVAAGAVASDRTVYVNALAEDMETDMRTRVASIKTRVVVLYPYRAGEVTKESVDALYKGAYAAMPNATLTRIDDSLHFIMQDQPDAFHRAVKDFLTSGK